VLRRIPYVIDNDQHKLGAVLNQVLEDHRDLALDIASAYFNIRGYGVLREQLKGVGSFRLLLGADPQTAAQVGILPSKQALQAALRGDLSKEPFDEATLELVEDLIRFVRENRVQVRLFDERFLHAKCYLFYGDPKGGPLFDRFRPVLGVVGSSNFTGPGLMHNRELNLVHKGIIPEDEVVDEKARAAALSHYTKERSDSIAEELDPYDGGAVPRVSRRISFDSRRVIKGEVGASALWELADWFERQWKSAQDFKQDFLSLLDTSKFGAVEYTPYQVYLKALYEYYKGELQPDGSANANLYQLNLAEFQADAVARAKRILQQYDGVMVCDSTGLGKTWIGLQMLLEYAYHKRWDAVVVCPASLRSMWEYRLHQTKIQAKVITQESLGREDYDVEQYGRYDLVMVDECHNFRSRDSIRYENLTRCLAINGGLGGHGQRKKVVLLTATPINNSVMDLYQQLQLITMGDSAYFSRSGIGRLDRYFYEARRELLGGATSASRVISNLLDQIMIRRTRQFIKQTYPEATIDGRKVHFPDRKLVTVRYNLEGTYAGIYKKLVRGIEELELAPYDLETYKAGAKDQMQVGRGQALVGIFKSRYLKRLESSVAAFRISIFRLMEYLLTFRHYIQGHVLLEPMDFWRLLATVESDIEDDAQEQERMSEGEDGEEAEEKRPQSRHKQIEANRRARVILSGAAKLTPGTYDLQRLNDVLDRDMQTLDDLYDLVKPIKPEKDLKLQVLKKLLGGELKGRKVLVFSSYKDTAYYIHKQVIEDKALVGALGGPHIRIIHGGTDAETRKNIVQGFAPVSNDKPELKGTEREIDLLFSTDVLSEGQNLQDCAYLVNYDLHWNPTRMIQRAGRIDRIGTDFDTLYIRNFFPDQGLDDLLKLVTSLQSKLRQIDTTIGLDASVLGEAINPKTFNTIRDIEQEKDEALEQVEAEAELASDEALVRHLMEYMKSQGGQAMQEVPDGIHSGLHKGSAKGVFAYYQHRDGKGQVLAHYWCYYDSATGEIRTNRLESAELIRCQPETPRVVDPALKDRIHTILHEVREHIVRSTKRSATVQAAPRGVAKEQNVVLVTIQQLANEGKIDGGRAAELMGALGRPLPRGPARDLKKAHTAYVKTDDVAAFVSDIASIAAKYGPAMDAGGAEPEAPTALYADDLHLVCFDFLS